MSSAEASQASVAIIDGATQGTRATVAAFHNADNQILPASSYGLNTGGVAQLLNPVGNLDRQRETGTDNIPSAGVATGTQQLAGPLLSTTVNQGGGIVGGASLQTVTLTAVSFTNRGVTSTYQVGTTLNVDPGAAGQEFVFLTAVNSVAKTVTGIFKNNHSNGATVQAFSYNQARDATIPDGSSPAGIGTSATYLFNAPANTVEFERSAAGELDGASGTGTNVAAEYEYNGGGPATNAGLASGLNFDRARNLQGKGVGSATQNAGGAAGATSITVSSAAATNTLQAGQQIRIDRNQAGDECAYVSQSYTPGTALITLQSALANTHTAATVEWDIFASAGPGLNGFTPAGIGIEEEALFNPVDGKYYIERSASADGMAVANIVAESPALFNGSTMDRARSNVDTAALLTFANQGTGTVNSADQTNYNGRGVQVVVDLTTVAGGATCTVNIQGKDAASGKYYTVLSSTALAAVATTTLTVYPGCIAAANSVANQPLPRTWRVQAVIGVATLGAGTIGASVIL